MQFRGIRRLWQLARILPLIVIAASPAVPAGQAQDIEGVTDSIRLQRILIRGLTRIYVEDFEGAASALQQGLDFRPNSPALLATMGKAQIGLGDLTSAEFYVQRALIYDPDNPDVWRSLAAISMDAGDAAAAVSALREVAVLSPNEVAARLDLIAMLVRLEQYEDASGAVEEAVSRLGPDPGLLRKQADIQERLGQSEALGVTLSRLIEDEPANIEFRYRLGALYVRTGEWEAAASTFGDLLQIDPDEIEASRALAGVLERQGKSHEAAAILQALRDPGADNTGKTMAEERFFVGGERNLNSTEQALRRRLEINETDTEAIVVLASILEERGEYAEAAELYRRHVTVDPRSLESWIGGIAALVGAGEAQEALAFADEALLLFPGYLPLQIERAAALIAAGRPGEARDLLEELNTRGADPEHRNRITALLRTLGE